MVGVMQAVGIDEVGAGAAQLLGPLIHQGHKGVLGSGHRLRQDAGRLVGGHQHHAVQQLLHRQHLALLDVGGAAGGVHVVDQGRRRHLLVQGQHPLVHGLQGQQGGHDLGDAGGILGVPLVEAVQHPPGLIVHQQGRLGVHLGQVHRTGLGHAEQARQQKRQQKNR